MALLKKRLLTFKRDKKMWAFVVLMPAFFVLAGILILKSVGTYPEPSLLLTPEVSERVRRYVGESCVECVCVCSLTGRDRTSTRLTTEKR